MRKSNMFLNLSFGFLIGILLARVIRDPAGVSIAEYVGLGMGLLAAIFHYWPRKQALPPAC